MQQLTGRDMDMLNVLLYILCQQLIFLFFL